MASERIADKRESSYLLTNPRRSPHASLAVLSRFGGVALESRQQNLLEAIVRADKRLREEGRPTEFLLIQGAGGVLGFKPGVPGATELFPSEADILDLQADGYVYARPSNSAMVSISFALSAAGRGAGQPRAVIADIRSPERATAPPSSADVLAWLYGLTTSGPGSSILNSGGALINEVLGRFGHEHVETVARTLVDLASEGLLLFDDPFRDIDQLAMSERISAASEFRLTLAGLDRVRGDRSTVPTITQIVHATNAQVAAGDIHNYVSFDELLDRAEAELGQLDDIDAATQEEARGILAKLRSASGTVATGTATSAGGALAGALLRQLLGLP